MHARLLHSLLVVCLLAPNASSDGWAIRIDGVHDEWPASDAETKATVSATDPKGDATEAFDLTFAAATTSGTTVYVRFEITKPLNLAAGPKDQGSIALKLAMESGRTLTVDFRKRQATLTSDDASSTVPWSQIQFAALPTYAATEFELRADLAGLGYKAGEKLTLQFDGSDSLETPLQVPGMRGIEFQTKVPSLERTAGSLRIASLNTLRSGFKHPERGPKIREMLQKVDADIICFNEEWEEQGFQDGVAALTQDSDAQFQTTWNEGCGIITKGKLTPLPFESFRGVAAGIEINDRKLVVVSVHFKCCGYAGSPEDAERVSEAASVAASFYKLRTGKCGEEFQNAPVVVLGDCNIVGSRLPIDVLENVGLEPIILRSPFDGSAMTWSGLRETESFWPGRLDWATSTVADQVNKAYLLEPEALGVEGAPVSDHKMLLIDLSVGD